MSDIELGLLTPAEYIHADLEPWAGYQAIIHVSPADRQYFLDNGFSVNGTVATNSNVYFAMSRTLTPEALGEVRADTRILSGVSDWVRSAKDRLNRPKLSAFQLEPLPETDKNLGELLTEYATVLREIAGIVCTENG